MTAMCLESLQNAVSCAFDIEDPPDTAKDALHLNQRRYQEKAVTLQQLCRSSIFMSLCHVCHQNIKSVATRPQTWKQTSEQASFQATVPTKFQQERELEHNKPATMDLQEEAKAGYKLPLLGVAGHHQTWQS
eukprot:123451-Amphidinium_carterae.1